MENTNVQHMNLISIIDTNLHSTIEYMEYMRESN